MRMLSRSVIWCIAITACGTDPTQPGALPKDLGVAFDFTTASWNAIVLTPSPNYVSLTASAVSNRGHIAGVEVSESGFSAAFVQRQGIRRYLSPLASGTATSPSAVNDMGVVVGTSSTPNAGNPVPIYYMGSDLPSIVPGVVRGGATDVSESEWIVGYATFLNPFRIRGFIWRPGWPQARILGDELPDTIWTSAESVNNAGYVAGQVGNRPAIWTPQGTLEAIPLPRNVSGGWASEINDAMQVVGTVSFFSDPITLWGGRRGFLWRQGQPMVLLHWTAGFSSYATDIDSRGRVYGAVATDSRYPAVWIAGTWTLLPNILSPQGGILYDANDCGVAVGTGLFSPFSMLWLTEC